MNPAKSKGALNQGISALRALLFTTRHTPFQDANIFPQTLTDLCLLLRALRLGETHTQTSLRLSVVRTARTPTFPQRPQHAPQERFERAGGQMQTTGSTDWLGLCAGFQSWNHLAEAARDFEGPPCGAFWMVIPAQNVLWLWVYLVGTQIWRRQVNGPCERRASLISRGAPKTIPHLHCCQCVDLPAAWFHAKGFLCESM